MDKKWSSTTIVQKGLKCINILHYLNGEDSKESSVHWPWTMPPTSVIVCGLSQVYRCYEGVLQVFQFSSLIKINWQLITFCCGAMLQFQTWAIQQLPDPMLSAKLGLKNPDSKTWGIDWMQKWSPINLIFCLCVNSLNSLVRILA